MSNENHGFMSFSGTQFVLTGIIPGCVLLGLVNLGILKAGLVVGIAVIALPFLFHSRTTSLLISQGHTVAGSVIGLFCGFWLVAGLSYICLDIPTLAVAKRNLDLLFISIEGVLVLASFYFQRHYLHDFKLRWTLIFLGLTVAVLFLTKLLSVGGVGWVDAFVIGGYAGANVNMKVGGILNAAAIFGLCGWILYVLYKNFEMMRPILRHRCNGWFDAESAKAIYGPRSYTRPVLIFMTRSSKGTEIETARAMLHSMAVLGKLTLVEYDGVEMVRNSFMTGIIHNGKLGAVSPGNVLHFKDPISAASWLDVAVQAVESRL